MNGSNLSPYIELFVAGFALVTVIFFILKILGKKTVYHGMLISIFMLIIFQNAVKNAPEINNAYFYGVLVCSVLYLLLGAVDEQIKLTFAERIVFQTVIAFVALNFGIRVHFISNFFKGGYFYLDIFSVPLTVIWILIIMNSFVFTNIFKTFSTSIGFLVSILCFTAAYFKSASGLPLIIAAIIGGVSLGYFLSELLFDAPPPGSSFLMPVGFLLASISITGVSKRLAFLTLLFPLLIVGIPVLSMSGMIMISYLKGIANGSEHKMKDRLAWMFSKKRVVVYLYFSVLFLSVILMLIISGFGNNFKIISLILCVIGFMYLERILLMKVEQGNITDSRNVKILGITVDDCTVESAAEKILINIYNNKKLFIITPNTEIIERARYDRELWKALQLADMKIPDGIGLVWAADFLGTPITERVPGIDVMKCFFKISKKRKVKVFLAGGKPGVVEKAANSILEIAEDIEICGMHHGYFKTDSELIEKVNENSPDILILGLGAPKQEKWIMKHLENLQCTAAIGIGGALDVFAGNVTRAPVFFQKYGLEWLYRLLCQPARFIRMLSIPRFVFHVFMEKLKNS